MPRPARPVPSAGLDNWPNLASGDPTVEVARALALKLQDVMGQRSARDVARATGVDYTTVSAILNGTTWPDLRTIARLEHGLRADLWPDGLARRLNAK